MLPLLSCHKCGGDDVNTVYHKSSYDCGYSEKCDSGNETEHLHYYCRNCSYTWTGKVLKTTNK